MSSFKPAIYLHGQIGFSTSLSKRCYAANAASSSDCFSSLFKETLFYKYNPSSKRLILIDKSRPFTDYAAFFKRPIPSIHGRHHQGTMTTLPAPTPKHTIMAISLNTFQDGKSFSFDAPFGELSYADQTADYLRIKLLESISMTIGITHIKKKTEATQEQHPSNLLICDDALTKQRNLMKRLDRAAEKAWKQQSSKAMSRDNIYRLSTTQESDCEKKSFIPQLPKPLRQPLLSTTNARLRVRGKVMGFASGVHGFAVNVCGWVAFLPATVLQQFADVTVTPAVFLERLQNQYLDDFYIVQCLLDTETGMPLITLALDVEAVREKLKAQCNESTDNGRREEAKL